MLTAAIMHQTHGIMTHNAAPQVYVHHFFAAADLLNAEGAELRGSILENPLPGPYHVVANGTAMEPLELRHACCSCLRLPN